MSNKRNPLLSAEKLIDEFCEVHPYHAQLYAKQSACWVRDYYENLITTGKLRVMEEVELWHPSVPEEQWRQWLTGSDPEFTMLVTKCCGRNPWTPPWLLGKAFIDSDGVFNRTPSGYVCPGCGNKIKR